MVTFEKVSMGENKSDEYSEFVLLYKKEVDALSDLVLQLFEAESDEEIKAAGNGLAAVVDYIITTKKTVVDEDFLDDSNGEI